MGLVVALQLRSTITQQNAITLEDMLRRRSKTKRKYAKKKFWCAPWLGDDRRLHYGHYDALMQEMRVSDSAAFLNFLRMPRKMFDEMLARIGPRIQNMDTNYRLAIDPGVNLAATLRYLVTGKSYPTVSYSFRVSRHTVAAFIPIVNEAIVEEYRDEVIPCPVTAEECKQIADEFQKKWSVPHALGALDGKHCAIRKPPNSGSLYYNYKNFCSVVLMALVDAPTTDFYGLMLEGMDICLTRRSSMHQS